MSILTLLARYHYLYKSEPSLRSLVAANQHKIEEGGRAMDRLDLLEEELASKDDDCE